MITSAQRERAERFMRMHYDGMFVLPNAWDAGSALVFEKQGFQAVATSSAGIAYTYGYPDGEHISFDDVASCVEHITRRISIPLSVDIERGYGETPEEIRDNARRLLQLGAVGFNIEDGRPDGQLEDLGSALERIAALVLLKDELNLDFVVNARTCVFLLSKADAETKLGVAIERGNAFRQAGADCIFVPCVVDRGIAGQLVKNIDAPINLLINAVLYDFEEIAQIGVRRLSLGCYPVRSVLNHLISIARDAQDGTAARLLDHSFSSREANRFFEMRR